MCYLTKRGGEVLLKYFGKMSELGIKYKSKNNPVTKADKETETLLKNIILGKYPQDKFICEESCSFKKSFSSKDRYWIIDPLDGTVNYTHRLPLFCVSIAVVEDGIIKYASVYNPYSKEFFFAKKGCGATKNDRVIKVSKTTSLSNSLLVTGFPYYTYKNPKDVFDLFQKFSLKSQAVRRLGSAALDMCYVAEGIFDGFWEENLEVWDVAAASLIVEEAGGKVTDFFGKDDYLFGRTIIATNGRLHRQMVDVIKEVQK